MKAIGFTQYLNIDDSRDLFKFEESIPVPKGHDLLVKVNAVSVNPINADVRHGGHDKPAAPKVTRWDACRTVKKMDDQASLFNPGDRIYCTGSFKRPGSNSKYRLVDERIVGYAPRSLSDDEITMMLLTSLTVYEALFEQLSSPSSSQSNKDETILIINDTDGMGSVATQLVASTELIIAATVSRPESINWVKSHGVKYTVDHRNNLVNEVRELDYKFVDYILELKDTDNHWKEMHRLIKPEGTIAPITENKRPINLYLLTQEKVTFAWEWMYIKSYYHTNDMQTQHNILKKIAYPLNNDRLKCTLTHSLFPLDATSLREAHNLVESGYMVGKVVVSGWKE